MSRDELLENLEKDQLKEQIPEFHIGDTLRVSTKIVEGEKERIQVFQGTVIARKGGGLSETFSLHRVSYGEGMERVFCIHSPRIVNIEVVKHGDVRRAKLYYLRGTSGKASKVAEKIGKRVKKSKTTKQAKPETSTQPKPTVNAEPEPEVVTNAPQESATESAES